MKVVYKVILLILFNWLVPMGLQFMGVPSEYYINYMMWFSALIVFSMLLPNKVGTMF